MKKLLILLISLLTSYISYSQGLNESYNVVYSKIKNGEFKDITFNTNDDRKWINAYSKIGWNCYGFPIDGNICDMVITMPYTAELVSGMAEYFNSHLVIVDSHNWNTYRQDGSLARVTLKSVDGNLVFYIYNIE